MPNDRTDKINSETQRRLSELIAELKDPRVHNGLVSVTRADVAGDLSHAKIYVSVLGGSDDSREVLRGLRSASGFLRRELGASLKLRKTPELTFIYDESIREGSRISGMIDELAFKEKPDEKEGDE